MRPDNILIDENGYPKINNLNHFRYFNEYDLGVFEENITMYLEP